MINKWNNEKGFTILEYLVYIPVVIIVSIALYLLFDTAVSANNDSLNAVDFSSESIVLDMNILKDLTKGHNEVEYIDGDSKKGFILNGTHYNFESKDFVDFNKLNIHSIIAGDKLIITTKYGSNTFTKEYNVKYWGGGYD